MSQALGIFRQRARGTPSREIPRSSAVRALQTFLIILVVSHPSASHAQDSRRIACARALQELARVSREVGDLLDADANDIEAHGGAMGPMMTQEFVNWYQSKRARDAANYPDLTETAPTGEERILRQQAADNFLAERTRGYRARIQASDARVARICPPGLIPK